MRREGKTLIQLVDMDGDEIKKGIYAMESTKKNRRRLQMSGDVAARSQRYLRIKRRVNDRRRIVNYRRANIVGINVGSEGKIERAEKK